MVLIRGNKIEFTNNQIENNSFGRRLILTAHFLGNNSGAFYTTNQNLIKIFK